MRPSGRARSSSAATSARASAACAGRRTGAGACCRRARAARQQRLGVRPGAGVSVSWSITGSAKPAATSMSPRSCMSMKPGVGAGQPSRAIELAQLAQRARAEAREHHEAVDREQRVPAREQRRRIGHARAASCWPRRAGAPRADRPHRPRPRRCFAPPAPQRPPRPLEAMRAARAARRRRARRRCAAPSDRRARAAPSPPPVPAHQSTTRAGCRRMTARRSAMRRATSPCSQGAVGCRRQRARSAGVEPRPDRSAPAPRRCVALGHGGAVY